MDIGNQRVLLSTRSTVNDGFHVRCGRAPVQQIWRATEAIEKAWGVRKVCVHMRAAMYFSLKLTVLVRAISSEKSGLLEIDRVVLLYPNLYFGIWRKFAIDQDP